MKKRERRLRCSADDCNASVTHLCDYPLNGTREGLTCDAPMCPKHAKLIKFNTHYCPDHADEPI